MRAIRSQIVWGSEHATLVVDRVRRATVSVWIATANLKDVHVGANGRTRRYHSVLQDFDTLAARGVELRILHAALPSRPFRDSFDRFPRLVQGGLQLRLCPRVHMKTVIVDGAWIYIGSANWTGAGLGVKGDNRRNFEIGWWSQDEQTIDEVQARYATIWEGHACRNCGHRSNCEAPLDAGRDEKTTDRTLVRLKPLRRVR
jgi:phosphatidylserine/phosphatidylglycerophosphate/cardiolipin synthase-like enzyme